MQVLEDCMNDRLTVIWRREDVLYQIGGSRHLLTELGDFEFYPTQHLLIFKPLISDQISRKY